MNRLKTWGYLLASMAGVTLTVLLILAARWEMPGEVEIGSPPKFVVLADIDFTEEAIGEVPGLEKNSWPGDEYLTLLEDIMWGPCVVSEGFEGMPQPLVLSTELRHRVQIKVFESAGGQPRPGVFQFSMNFLLGPMEKRPGMRRSAEEFAILFDLPMVSRINFATDGETGMVTSGFPVKRLASFSFGDPHALKVRLDTNSGTWSVWLDSKLVFLKRRLHRASDVTGLRSIRISLNGDLQTANKPKAFVDDLRLIEFISDEPGGQSGHDYFPDKQCRDATPPATAEMLVFAADRFHD